jgi:hypothetical protein
VTKAAGLNFVHNSGRAGKRWLPETMGSGAVWFDADADGYPDLFLVNSKDWTPKGRRSLGALYRNNRNGTFTDVTASSGLGIELFGLGVAAADYDNDGREDLYITALEGDRLFRNEGNFRFKDVTKTAGINNANFGTSVAFLDYDKDGHADILVANYVQWTAKGDLFCSMDGNTKSYCTPESYKGVPPKLYRNRGNGTFEEVAAKAGIADVNSKALGIAVFDVNNDGWPDVFLANDTQPNRLYRNNKNGTFTDIAVSAGVAFSEDGVARGAMGVSARDYDESGRASLAVGNFSNQMLGLYHNEGNGLFVDEAPRSTIGRSSLLSLTFGLFFFDYDLDGRADLFAANGHIDEEIGRVQPKIQFRQPPLLFRNEANGKFADVTKAAGLMNAYVARGAAYADYDRDGDLDVIVTNNHGPAVLLKNEGGNANNYLSVRLQGRKSNRSALGAVVRIGKQWQTVTSGASYCSQSDLALTFGLGKEATVAKVDIEWPSGKRQMLTNVKARQHLVIVEPE